MKVINAEDNEEYPNIVIEWHDGAFGGVEKGFEPNEEDLLAGWEIRNGILPDVEITGNILEQPETAEIL